MTLPKAPIPLIGRKAEWYQLLSLWQNASAGQSQLVFISGDAGIGKTRLVEELENWALCQGILTSAAFCYPAEGNLPYAPVVSWLRAQAFPKLEKTWVAEIGRLLPEVQQNIPGLPRVEPLHEAWQRQRLFEALARALLAWQQPLLLVLEDIHWADQDTLEWLHYLLRFAPKAPILIVATMRSGEIAIDHPLAALQATLRSEGRCIELKLRPLSEDESVQLTGCAMLESSGQTLSAEKAGGFCREAEGNPLFLIEFVRLGRTLPGLHADREDPLVDSERIQSVLSRRISQLNSATREMTALAATIGRAFSLDVLRQASGESDEKIVEDIDELIHRHFIQEIAPDAYDFTHDLLRQAAFSQLSTAHRRLLHRKVAEAYQRLDQALLYPREAEIASHYERAGLLLQAIQHYRLAAESAAGIFANADAQSHLQRAIELAETIGVGETTGFSPAEFAMLLERMGDILALDGKYSQAQVCFEHALAQPFSPSGAWRSQIYRKISDALVLQYQHGLAYIALDQAELALQFSNMSSDIPERLEWLQIQLARTQLFYWDNHPDQMETIIQQIGPTIEVVGSLDQQNTLLSLQYQLKLRQERYRLSEETVAIGRHRLELTEKLSDPFELAVAQF